MLISAKTVKGRKKEREGKREGGRERERGEKEREGEKERGGERQTAENAARLGGSVRYVGRRVSG